MLNYEQTPMATPKPDIVINTFSGKPPYVTRTTRGAVDGCIGQVLVSANPGATGYVYHKKKGAVGTNPNVRPRPITRYWVRKAVVETDGSVITRANSTFWAIGCNAAINNNLYRYYFECSPAAASLPTLQSDEAYNGNLRTRVEVEHLLKVKDGSDFNAGIEWVQRRKTRDSFVEACERVRGNVVDFSKRHPKDWRRALQKSGLDKPLPPFSLSAGFIRRNRVVPNIGIRDAFSRRAANEWLAMQYGWTQMLSSVFGALNILERFQLDESFLIYTGTRRAGDFLPATFTSGGQDGHFTLSWKGEKRERCQMRTVHRVKSGVLSNLASVGVTNPAVWVWDSLPWTHIIDWVIPVSNWLAAFDAGLGKEFVQGSVTQMRWFTSTSFDTIAGTGETLIKPLDAGNYTYYYMDRYPLATWPVPGLYYKNPVSMMHIANAAAHLVQAFAPR